MEAPLKCQEKQITITFVSHIITRLPLFVLTVKTCKSPQPSAFTAGSSEPGSLLVLPTTLHALR